MRQQLGTAPSRTLDGVDKTYVDTAVAACLQDSNNLSDLASASTARSNLGLGTAAVMAGPASTIVGTTDTQTLTNKTLTSATLSSPTITSAGISLAGSSSGTTTLTASPTASGSLTLPAVVDTLTGNSATQTLTNKTLSAPKIATISNTGTLTLPTSTDTLVGRATTDTLTNKTISGASNTITSVAVSALVTTGSPTSSTFLNGMGAWAVPGGITGTSTPTANNVAEWDANTNMSADVFIPGFTATATAAGTTTLTINSTQVQQFTGTSTQTVVLPSTSIVAGMGFFIANSSTGAVTVQASNAATITVLASNTSGFFTANVAAPNIPAGWTYFYNGVMVTGGKTPAITNSINLAGTDGTTMTFPGASDTVAGVAAAQTLTNKTLTNPVLTSPAFSTIANSGTLTLPAATDTLVGRATTDTLTNKTLTSPTLTSPVLGTPASGNLANCTFPTLNQNTTGTAAGITGKTTPAGNLVGDTDTQTLSSKTLTNPTVNGYTEAVQALGTIGGVTKVISALSNGTLVTATLTTGTTCSFTLPTPAAGQSFMMVITTPSSGTVWGYGFTTPSGSLLWGNAGTPSATQTISKHDIFTFFSDGTNWYGSYAQGF